MWKKTTISQLCQIRLPIIQAGMAGSTSAELVAAVSEYGGLGTRHKKSMDYRHAQTTGRPSSLSLSK